MFPHFYGMLMVGAPGPDGVFDPWVRWDLGLDGIRSFRVFVLSCRVVSCCCCLKNHGKIYDTCAWTPNRVFSQLWWPSEAGLGNFWGHFWARQV